MIFLYNPSVTTSSRHLPLHKGGVGECEFYIKQRQLLHLYLTKNRPHSPPIRSARFPHNGINIVANAVKIFSDLIVRHSNYPQSVCLKEFRAPSVFPNVFILIVLRAVKLYNQFSLCTVKIRNISPEHLLPGETDGIVTQEIIPQPPLLFCHILSQRPCKRNELLIVL